MFSLVESGQWLENLDQTHLVLASGKLVLEKRFQFSFFLYLLDIAYWFCGIEGDYLNIAFCQF